MAVIHSFKKGNHVLRAFIQILRKGENHRLPVLFHLNTALGIVKKHAQKGTVVVPLIDYHRPYAGRPRKGHPHKASRHGKHRCVRILVVNSSAVLQFVAGGLHQTLPVLIIFVPPVHFFFLRFFPFPFLFVCFQCTIFTALKKDLFAKRQSLPYKQTLPFYNYEICMQ